jgi:hypothetical protein
LSKKKEEIEREKVKEVKEKPTICKKSELIVKRAES